MNAARIIPGAERQLKNHASLQTAIRNSFTMAYRGVLKIRHTPEQLFDVVFQPIIFTLMFTYMFGGAIAGSVQNYLPFLIAGILAQSVVTASLVTGVQLREDMDKGVFNRFRTLPIARIAPLAGALLADTVRYAVAATVTFATGFLIGYRPGAGIAGVIGAALLVIFFAWSISWIFAFFGVIARSASSVQGIAMVILFPLTFLSNAFVPVNTLPGGLQMFVKVNPVTYLVSAVRQITDAGAIGRDFWLSLLGAAAVVAVFAPLTVRAYMRKA